MWRGPVAALELVADAHDFNPAPPDAVQRDVAGAPERDDELTQGTADGATDVGMTLEHAQSLDDGLDGFCRASLVRVEKRLESLEIAQCPEAQLDLNQRLTGRGLRGFFPAIRARR